MILKKDTINSIDIIEFLTEEQKNNIIYPFEKKKNKKKKKKSNVSVFIFVLQKDKKNGKYNLLVQRRRFTSKKEFNNHHEYISRNWEVQGGRCKKSEVKDHSKTIEREFTEETGMIFSDFNINPDDFHLFLTEQYMDESMIKHSVFNYYTIIDPEYNLHNIQFRTREAESVGLIELDSLEYLSRNFYDPSFYENFVIKLKDTLNGKKDVHVNIYT
jgi:hypothetical protein